MFEKKLSHLIKRDGSVKDFDANKIVAAIAKAGKATGEFDESRAARITEERVLPSLVALNLVTPHIEQVQDAVERALFEEGFFKTLRAYIVYREQRQKARDARQSWVNVESSINEYLQQLDWRVNANANQGYSLGGLILNVSGKVVANYWLNYIYPAEIGRAHREADFHIHDLDMLSGYCAGWSLRTLLTEGLNGVPGKVEAGAPKHLSSATGQIVNFLGTMQNEWAGAQAFSSFDTYLAPFIKKDNVPYEEVLQSIQELIYNLNVPSRWGTQTPFTNLTFDWTCPEDLKDQHPIIGGEEMPFTYGDCKREMDMINRAYIEVMTKGDAKGRVFTFPIPTYNITPDFDWDSENAWLCVSKGHYDELCRSRPIVSERSRIDAFSETLFLDADTDGRAFLEAYAGERRVEMTALPFSPANRARLGIVERCDGAVSPVRNLPAILAQKDERIARIGPGR